MKDINRLLSAYPPGSNPDPEQALRNYLLAVEDYPWPDVTAAVDAFIKGSAPGVNASFLPPASAVGAECRRQMNLRLDREARDKAMRPKLPPPDVERTVESQARVRGMVAQLVERTAEQTRSSDATKRKNALWQRTNERFNPSADEAEMKRRLGYEVGGWEEDQAA